MHFVLRVKLANQKRSPIVARASPLTPDHLTLDAEWNVTSRRFHLYVEIDKLRPKVSHWMALHLQEFDIHKIMTDLKSPFINIYALHAWRPRGLREYPNEPQDHFDRASKGPAPD